MNKTIQVKLEFQNNRNHWLSFAIDLQRTNEIVALTGNLSILTKGKIASRHSKQIQALFMRAQKIDSKLHDLAKQYEKDVKDLDQIISYYIRNKDAVIKDPVKVQLHGYSLVSAGDISATSIKLEGALNDFTNAIAELWEILRFIFAFKLGVKPQSNWENFIDKNKIVDYQEFTKLSHLWNTRKHSIDLAISSLGYQNNHFIEPLVIKAKDFNNLSISDFVDKLLDDSIFILKKARDLKIEKEVKINNE